MNVNGYVGVQFTQKTLQVLTIQYWTEFDF